MSKDKLLKASRKPEELQTAFKKLGKSDSLETKYEEMRGDSRHLYSIACSINYVKFPLNIRAVTVTDVDLIKLRETRCSIWKSPGMMMYASATFLSALSPPQQFLILECVVIFYFILST